MSKPTRAERLQAIVDWIRDGREYGSVSEPDPDELEAIVGEVEAMEAENHQLTATPYAERVRENLALKENAAGDATTIAKLERELDGLLEWERLCKESNDALDITHARIAELKGVLLTASYEGAKASHYKGLMIGRYVIDFDTAGGDPVRAALDAEGEAEG